MVSLLLLLALFGHVFLWIGMVNRVHALAVPYKVGHAFSLSSLFCAIALPMAFAGWLHSTDFALVNRFDWRQLGRVGPLLWSVYLPVCWVSAAVTLSGWVWRIALRRPTHLLRFARTRRIELAGDSCAVSSREQAHHFLVHLPGNQILKLDVTERAIDVPRLAPALDTLSIMHLSDFHFTGLVGKSFFREVVRRSNEMQPDLLVITGDVIDHSDCIDWIPETLGKLQSRYGVYYVLGNHDIRHDVDRLRKVLSDSGLVDLGGRWVEIEVGGEPIVLAGNELPWIAPAADMRGCPRRTPGGGPLRIVLAHSPDQLHWAQAQDADLLLAGHTHGGQIRLPLIGAVVSASRLGVNYDSGIFYAPPTIMHISRGVSGELPVRLNCPPEVTRLVLRSPEPPIGNV